MKYRIKDKLERKRIDYLLGISEFESELQDNSLTIRVSFAGNDFGVWFFETEPVKELAEKWHPYPQEKPSKNDTYLIARKGTDTVDFAVFNSVAKKFRTSFDANIFAWQELPKIWKE